MRRLGGLAAVALLAAAISATPAVAQPTLRFAPDAQQLTVGETGSLTVNLDQPLDVRTIEVWVRYDPTVVKSLSGQPGQLFLASGCTLFPIFEDEGPDAWYGGAVTMGPYCFLSGPGELFRWDFEALADGVCPVQVDSVALYDPMAVVYSDVTLAGATITVGDVSEVAAPKVHELALTVAPNPFNPRTTIRFSAAPDEEVTVAVFDLTGRLVTTLWRGSLGREAGSTKWDGRDDDGRVVAGGVYLFRISSASGRQQFAKGILLK